MTLGFVETWKFMQLREEYFAGDASYSAFQQALLNNPESGSVMPGCGGLRIIYLHVPAVQIILFLKVYDKDEADDLTPDQRKVLTQAAGAFREAALQRNQKRD